MKFEISKQIAIGIINNKDNYYPALVDPTDLKKAVNLAIHQLNDSTYIYAEQTVVSICKYYYLLTFGNVSFHDRFLVFSIDDALLLDRVNKIKYL